MMKEKERCKQQEGKSANPYDEFSLPNCVIALNNLGAIDNNTYRLAIWINLFQQTGERYS